MQFFTNTLKLYYFRDKDMVSFSILSSPTQVQTFYIQGDNFDRVIRDAPNGGADVENFFIERKKRYLRFSHHGHGMQTNFRIEIEKWDKITADYLEKKNGTPDNLITCIVE